MTRFWRNSFLIGAVLILEACVFYMGFSVATTVIQLPEANVPFSLAFLALLWSFVLSMYIQTVRFSLNVRGILGLVASVISLVVLSNLITRSGLIPFGVVLNGDLRSVATVMVSFVFLVALWWRGSRVAQEAVTLDTIRSTFQRGLGVVFLAVIVDAISDEAFVSGFLVLAFFGVGLLGMATARFASESGESKVMSANWFLSIGVAVGGVLLLGLVISLLGLGGLDDVTRTTFGLAGKIGLWILKPIALGIGFIAAGMLTLINWLASFFSGGDLSSLAEAQRQIDEFHESLEDVEQTGPPALLVAFLKGTTFLLSAAIVGWILFRLFRFRRYLGRPGEVEETRESLFSWERANRDLASILGGWWDNLVQSAGDYGRRRPQPQNPRELYHSFLLLAQDLGHPKREEQTPKEHQNVLSWTLPLEPVAHIVDGFQDVHYGHEEVAEYKMNELLQDWTDLQQFVTDSGKPNNYSIGHQEES